MAGEITVSLDKVKELRSSGSLQADRRLSAGGVKDGE